MVRLKRLLTFSGVLWLLAASAVFYLLCLPPLQDAWAYYLWERVPCKVTSTDGRPVKFLFVYQNATWNCTRVDFWVRDRPESWLTETYTDPSKLDETCYVAPGRPTSAVLRLDAHKRLDRAGSSVLLSGFVIAVAGVLSYLSRKRQSQKAVR